MTINRYTPQEYYARERLADYKSDYFQGQIFATARVTARHCLISANIGGEVGNRLKGKPCRAYDSNLRMAVLATGFRCYPDVSVYCGPLRFDEADTEGETAVNPIALFEVLSKSTEAYDRGLKAENFRRLETLQAYVLVSQDAPHVEICDRQAGGKWLLREVNTLEAVLSIPALEIDLPLAEVYDGVEFPPPPDDAPDLVA